MIVAIVIFYIKFDSNNISDIKKAIPFQSKISEVKLENKSIQHTDLILNIANFNDHLLNIDASSQDADETYKSGTYNYSPWNMVDED